MFAVICWNSKNGVALEREELEVQSSSKYVIMNGGKQEVGAEVNMVFRKDIWGGIIQSMHGRYINTRVFCHILEFCLYIKFLLWRNDQQPG